MRTGAIPLQFDIADAAAQLRGLSSGQIGTDTIEIPGAQIRVRIVDEERRLAEALLVRLRNRRVLSNQECCDDCIERALLSILEIRQMFVEAQAELVGNPRVLAALLELMLAPIRQFLTFAERLDAGTTPRHEEFWRDQTRRQTYFDALEMLRKHLSKCIRQLATISSNDTPPDMINYADPWQEDAYKSF